MRSPQRAVDHLPDTVVLLDRDAMMIGYLQPRLHRMNYPSYRIRDWQIGTGIVESTARQLVGLRLKGPGMHWSEAGAVAVTALRAQSLNPRWHLFRKTLVMNC